MVFHTLCVMLFLCVLLHTMSLGKSLQLLCIFPFGMLCLSAINMMSVKIMLAVCITITHHHHCVLKLSASIVPCICILYR